jgi:uncharacterized protein (DUF488 family)
MEPVFTIGHATRPLEELAGLLRANDVTCLVDVRTVPRSRTNPQFNKDAMPGSLERYGIGYRHIAALGGLRGRKVEVPADVNGFWENQSFHNYADYAMSSQEFVEGLDRLLSLGGPERCAIMCAESVWWRCHRRIITDYLLAAGESVFHIVSSDVPEAARITPAAVAEARSLVYPAAQPGLL